MGKNPKQPDRPRDLSQLAKRIVDITTGEVDDDLDEIDEAARKRGEARAKKLSPDRRREIAEKAARARWGKDDG